MQGHDVAVVQDAQALAFPMQHLLYILLAGAKAACKLLCQANQHGTPAGVPSLPAHMHVTASLIQAYVGMQELIPGIYASKASS